MTDLASTFKKVVEAEQEALRTGKSRSEALQAAFDRFYRGDIAQEMARFYQENGGDFTLEDFAAYEPIWADPVHTTFRGYDIYSSPSTSRGGVRGRHAIETWWKASTSRRSVTTAQRCSTSSRRRSRLRSPTSTTMWETRSSPISRWLASCRKSMRRSGVT